MNLREIMADNFKIFSKMGDESRIKNIEAIRYIDILSNTTGIDISGWDLHEIFAKRGNTFLSDPNEINRTFFSHHETIIAAKPVEPGTLPEEAQKRMNELAARAVGRRLEEFATLREGELRQARDHYRHYEAKLRSAFAYTLDIAAHAREGVNVAHQIMTIQAEGFWTNAALEGKYVYLTTNNNIVNTHKNLAAGVDLRVDLGKLAVRIDLETMNLIVLPYMNNILSRAHYHPHISANGNVCWGNGQDAALKALARGDLLSTLRLLAGILCNYNDGNPYVALAQFHTQHVPIDINNVDTQPEIMRLELRRREQFAKQQAAKT